MSVEAKARERLIVALDVPSADEARALVEQIGDAAGIYKIGLELLYAGGAELAAELARNGQSVFIDAKLLDIPATVERATASIARLGGAFLTVHGHDRQTLEAAFRGRGAADLKLLAVTVLTSVNENMLASQGVQMTVEACVQNRAQWAREAGFDGVVASPKEAAAIRAECGADFTIVTPGIRPSGADHGDQMRVATPAEAIAAGADFLVIGRPITRASDPRQAAHEIAKEIAGALA